MKKLSAQATVQIFTIMNSLGVSLTYFDSIVNFLWHTGLSDHPLTDCRENWEVYAVATATILCVFIAMNNQRVMPDHIAKFMNKFSKEKLFAPTKTNNSAKGIVIDAVGCVSKAVISSISLLSSIKDYIEDWKIAGTLSSFSLLGNMLAIFSVLMEHRKDRNGRPWSANLSRPFAQVLAMYVKICYGLAQGGIYSNAIMNPLVMTGVLKSRPAFNSPDALGKTIFWSTAYPCLEFMWGSGEAMYKRTLQVLEARSEDEQFESKPKPRCWQKWRGGVASVFRSLALIAAIFCFFYLLSQGNVWASAIPAALSVLAVPGVFALLYPLEEEEEEYYQLLGNPHIFLVGRSPLLINSGGENTQSEAISFKLFGVF